MRLATASKFLRSGVRYASTSFSGADPSAVRNLGIIAHIDAGKTTTTERMLYYAGITKRLGNVDSGDTVTDFLEAERERGITIQSAAISFNWHQTQLNLIDTPGHADFNFEVVRSLRVLDGAITILDSVAGVEALTEKVWSLASQLQIPRIVYINKMDRAGAGYSRTVKEIVSKLRTKVALVNIPYFEGDKFVGIIDVLHGKRIEYKSEDGKQIEVLDCSNTPQCKVAEQAREALVEQLSEVDDAVVNEYIETEQVSTQTLINALQKAASANEIVPVLCGSSFRNMGIQSLLDAAVQYLPAPNVPKESGTVEMLAFKVRQDPQRGTLVYIRVYKGTLRRNATIFNTATQKVERVTRLLRMQADNPVEIESVEAGDIAVLGGTSNIRTGDTLVAHASKLNGISTLSRAEKELALLPIPVPPPVFVTRIEPKGPGDARGMQSALEILLREDPSLHLAYDDDAGQYLLSGMGELHLEIAIQRLIEDLKARVDVGEVMITYKETLNTDLEPAVAVGVDMNGAETKVRVSISANNKEASQSKASQQLTDFNVKTVRVKNHPRIDSRAVDEAVTIGINPVLAQGGLLGKYALCGLRFNVDVEIALESDSVEKVASLVRKAASEALSSADKAAFSLLEPVMSVCVSAPEGQIGTVMTDISTTRRGTILGMSNGGGGGYQADEHDDEQSEYTDLAKKIWTPVDHTMYMSKHGDEQGRQVRLNVKVPLRKMVGYLSSLRSMTQGRGTFEMTFSEFSEAPPQDVNEILYS